MRTADPVKIQRIIDAAAKLFAERHYHEVRMDDIAANAGVAKGTIYLHFKDKDDLYQASRSTVSRSSPSEFAMVWWGVRDPAAKLLSVNREVIRYFEHHAFTLELIRRIDRLDDQETCDKEAFFEVRDGFMEILRSILDEFPEAAAQEQRRRNLPGGPLSFGS